MNYIDAVAALAAATWGESPLLSLAEFRDSLGASQTISKRALAATFWQRMKTGGKPGPLVIDASWWGSALLHLAAHPACIPDIVHHVTMTDIDPRMIPTQARVFGGSISFGSSEVPIWSVLRDIHRGSYAPELYCAATAYINTSLEHLPHDYQLPEIAKGGLYFLQSNNMLFADGHINCMPTEQAFVAWVRDQGLTVLESAPLDIGDGHQRFNLVARRG